MIIPAVTTPKKIKISLRFIILLNKIASGKLKAAIPIMKAIAVPKGTPLSNKATAIGTIAAQLP